MVIENFSRDQVGSEDEPIEFHISVYFVVVTLSTVGYGEIVPVTDWGKVMVIFVIVATIVIIPTQSTELLRLMSM